MNRAPALMACIVLLSSCGREAEPYPRLLPTAQILAEPALPDHAPDAAAAPPDAAIEARAGELRRRADALRGPVIEPEARARMQKSQ